MNTKDPIEQWNRLNRAVNIKHHIGATAHQTLEDAICGKPKVEEKKETPIKAKPEQKSSAKTVKKTTVKKSED